ncbi:MAG: hypothetical protein ACKOUS_16675, partial [Alphaproteobacteria bacterium]
MATTILLDAGDTRLRIALDAGRAPRTAAALLASLPAEIDLHCAKIAGNHILWHAPFVVDAEATGDVMQVPPGGLLYWPERQFLELVFDALQAESAQVTHLGGLEAGVDALRALGRRVQERQGRDALRARLSLAGAGTATPSPPAPMPPGLAALVAAREAIWRAPPAEIAEMMARRGVMLPAGPLVYAEGYARALHETLWRLRAEAAAGDHAFAARAGVLALRLAVARVGGFCTRRPSARSASTPASR